MAVEVVYRSSRDPGQLFMDKAEADRHDKMLELAEALREVLQTAVPSLSEQQGEELGIFMARNRAVFAKAFRGPVDALAELERAPQDATGKAVVLQPQSDASAESATQEKALHQQAS